jgi:hypothetical protein
MSEEEDWSDRLLAKQQAHRELRELRERLGLPEQPEAFEITKLMLKRGDMLVVKIPPEWEFSLENLSDHLQASLPEGVNALVITKEVELTVLSREKIPERRPPERIIPSDAVD